MFARSLAPAVAFAALFAGPLRGADAPGFAVAAALGDGAVLQRDVPVPVWGRGTPGAAVTVRFAGNTVTATVAADGNWTATLPPMHASETGRDLVAASGADRVERADLLVGDVWVLAGQTNMAHPLSECDGGRLAAKGADHPWLRCFFSADEPADRPARDCCAASRWKTCSPSCAGDVSGVGYFFALELRKFTKAPVGLVLVAEPDAGTECWARPGLFRADARLNPALDDYRTALATLPAQKAEWERRRAEFERKTDAAEAAGLPVPAPCDALRRGPLGPEHPLRPHALYLGRVRPLQPMAVKGVVWYEGEGNARPERAAAYDRLLPAVIRDWREGWKQPDLPFVLVQLPSYEPGKTCDYARVREAQTHAAADLGHCALAVTLDLGGPDEACPADKRPFGHRAALAARRVAYRDLSAPLAPLAATVRRDGASLIVHFRETGGALKLVPGESTGFEVKEAFGPFRAARAEVVAPDAVRVWHPEIAGPLTVRYAWAGCPAVTLFGGSGLPAAPFRASAGR